MSDKNICKTVHQYSKTPISPSDMEKLLSIAEDYRRVKEYVYRRYGGIKSLPKLYPGYTVQNEMTESGLKGKMNMPSVYFYLAVFEALGDIKTHWSQVKRQILDRIRENDHFSAEEKHYLRYALKMSQCYQSLLLCQPYELPEQFGRDLEAEKIRSLDNYLRRQTRRYRRTLTAAGALGFRISERAYRYKDGGIYISTKEKRKRIFVPLTDNNQYKCQLYLSLYPEKREIVLHIPVKARVKRHTDYQGEIGLALGYRTMFTTSAGKTYGELLGEFSAEEAEWVQRQIRSRNRISAEIRKLQDPQKALRMKQNNLGRDKYAEQKRRYDARLEAYVNQEINRLLEVEKPAVIYVPRLPRHASFSHRRWINRNLAMWRRGYIRRRLEQKCKSHSVELVEVTSRDISNICSACGSPGSRKNYIFQCPVCGTEISEKANAAHNALNRGQEQREHSLPAKMS